MGSPPSTASNRELLPAYALPYLAYLAPGVLPLGETWAYALRGVLVVGALAWARPALRDPRGPGSAVVSAVLGVLAGGLGLALWLALVQPPEAAPAWSTAGWTLRAASSIALAPLVEELLMRGFLLGLLVQWERALRNRTPGPLGHALDHASYHALAPGTWSVAAVVISSGVFALGHSAGELLAAFTYGIWMCALYVARRDLIVCIAAHAATNAGLAALVLTTDRWELW